MGDKLRKPFKKRHSVVYHSGGGSNRVNKYLSQAIEARSVDREKSTHVNIITLCFKDKYKERQYHEEKDRGFGMALACAMAILISLTALQITILPRTVILVILFLVAFVWISVLLILVLGARLHCIRWDISKHFLLRLGIMIFTVVIIYSVAQVNVFTCLEETVCSTNMSIGNSNGKSLADEHRICPFPQYIILSCIISFFPLVIFLRLPMMLKAALLIPMAAVFLIVIEFTHNKLFECTTEYGVPLNITGPVIIIHFVLAVLIHGRQVEWTARLDFLWNAQAYEEKADMHELQNSNRRILFNLLPSHVATHFLDNQFRSNMDLYHQSYSRVGVCFASIPNFMDFYMELDGNNQGVECLRLLNEIIADFDELLDHEKYKEIDKIKTVGSCYMAAIGLMPEYRISENDIVLQAQCMSCLVDLVLEMKDRLSEINENSYNNFMLRVGLNIGPVVAGVIGARKPQYDIWGNTVNVASRMDSTGLPNHTQCTEEVYQLLKNYPYVFQCRGRVKVKGKGEMTTYFLIERKINKNSMRNNYDFIGSGDNVAQRSDALLGVTPLSLIERGTHLKGCHTNNSSPKLKPNNSNNIDNTHVLSSNSPVIPHISRYSEYKRAEIMPSYNQPKPIITDIEKPEKMNKSPSNTFSTIFEESKPVALQHSSSKKGDAWEKLKELSSNVPPPPSEPEQYYGYQSRPVTIISPTGVQETNLDDISPPLPPRDHTNSQNYQLWNKPTHVAKEATHKTNLINTPFLFSSPDSQRTNSYTETNRATVESQDSLDDIDTTQATSTRAAGRPSSIDESSIYRTSSSSDAAPITDAEITVGYSRTDLDTPSPAFKRNSNGSASLQWVYPNPENPNETDHSFMPTHNREDYCIFIKRSNDGLALKKKTDSSAQTDGPHLNPKKHYHHHHHHHHNHNHSKERQSNLKYHGSFSGSCKSDGSSGTNSARKRHRNSKRDKSKDDDDLNIPLLSGKQSFAIRSAASDTEEEFDSNLIGATSKNSGHDFITRSPSFGSNSERSQRKGSLPDYYKSNNKYSKIVPKRLPSLESMSKQSLNSRDFVNYSPKLRSKGSLPMIPLQEIRSVNDVLSELVSYKKERVKQKDVLCMKFDEEDEKLEPVNSNKNVMASYNKSKLNKDPHKCAIDIDMVDQIRNRAKNAAVDSIIDVEADLVDLEDQIDSASSSLAYHRFPLDDDHLIINKTNNTHKSKPNFNRLLNRIQAKESEYENLDSDVPYYETNIDNMGRKNYSDVILIDDCEELASDDSDEALVTEDKSYGLINNCDDSIAGLDGISVLNDTGLTDAEEALSDVNSLLNDPGHDADMDDTSMSSRSGASSRMLDIELSIDSHNLMYDSEFEYSSSSRPQQNGTNYRSDVVSDDECFNGPTSDLDIDYFQCQQTPNATNIVTPTTLAERLENIRAITNNITRNFGHSKNECYKTNAANDTTDDDET